jgi:hypothetical protein
MKKDPCWKNYTQVGTKRKGNRIVPNCVPKKVAGKMKVANFSKMNMKERMAKLRSMRKTKGSKNKKSAEAVEGAGRKVPGFWKLSMQERMAKLRSMRGKKKASKTPTADEKEGGRRRRRKKMAAEEDMSAEEMMKSGKKMTKKQMKEMEKKGMGLFGMSPIDVITSAPVPEMGIVKTILDTFGPGLRQKADARILQLRKENTGRLNMKNSKAFMGRGRRNGGRLVTQINSGPLA